ncbi:MAG: cadherin-like beta sandwich domain-containing protein, partial [Dysgonamonadaceae bacterium]|nr:cadherin-like beta sandwich domain-containing protein [Dysgonamonadaceae bacterium]
MKKIYFLVFTLILSISAVRAGLPPEFSVVNADGVPISYTKCENWFTDGCTENGVLVTWNEDEMEYADEVVIPEQVVHEGITYRVIGIAPWTFDNCTELISVGIPASVYFIDSYAFSGSSNLTDIYVAWNDPAAVSVDEPFDGITASNITLHVPVGVKAAYENDNVWKSFNIVDDGKTAGDGRGYAKLSNLTVSAGVLSPAFSPSRYSYTVLVPLSVEHITLTATPVYGGIVSGDGQKSLNPGENVFYISVTLADGTLQNTYTVTVIRMDVNFTLELISNINYTGNAYFEDYMGARLYIPDRKHLTYRLITGNLPSSFPLHFAAGNKTLDRTLTVTPNYIYEIEVRIWVNKNGMSCVTHFDAYGRPSWSEIVYGNRTTATTSISYNAQPAILSEIDYLGPPESIEFIRLEAKGGTSIATVDKDAFNLSANP